MDRSSLEEMLKNGNDNLMLRYTLGNLYLKDGNPELAVIHLKEALNHNNDHSASWKHYAKALMETGDSQAAINAYEKGIEVAETVGDIQAAKEMKVFLKRLLKQQINTA